MTINLRDHPRAAELVALAKERDEESRAKLGALLEELGLPQDTFSAADKALLPKNGQVLVGDSVCAYEAEESVVQIHGAIPFADKLVAHADRLNCWKVVDGVQVQSVGEGSFPGLCEQLRDRLWEAAKFYQCWNSFAKIEATGFWEILRYDRGVGADACLGQGQLSALVYLNDGFEGGETRFCHSGLTISPVTGKAALFPPFYTHPHEEVPVLAGTKYVARGWFK